MPAGRPSDFNQFIADQICERIADGDSLRTICASDEDMPSRTTVFKWLAARPEFADHYARAREAQADALIEETREIVDDGRNDWMEKQDKDGRNIGWQLNGEAVARSRLRAEQRRWEAAKLKPKVYGDKLGIEHSGSITYKDASVEDLMMEFNELLAKGALVLPPGVEIEDAKPAEEAEDFSDLL